MHPLGPRGAVPPNAPRFGVRTHRHKHDYDENNADVLVDAATGAAEAEGYEMGPAGAAGVGGVLAVLSPWGSDVVNRQKMRWDPIGSALVRPNRSLIVETRPCW